MLSWSLSLCEEMAHDSGTVSACRSDVERRFPGCLPAFLAEETTPEEFGACLGFEVPPPPAEPVVLGECDASRLSMEFSVAQAKRTRFESSVEREIDGQTLFVADTPTLTAADVRHLRLEDQEFGRRAVIQITKTAGTRFAKATRANIGEPMVMSLNGSVTAPIVMSEITGREIALNATGIKFEDVCRSP